MSSSAYQFHAYLLFIIANILSAVINCRGDDQLSTNNANGFRAVSTLKFLTVVSRHGSRGLLYTYPKNPYSSDNRTLWPNGPAQLTKKGRIQMFNLGTKIRYLYNGFLNDKYFFEEFKAYSTIVDRTLMSAQTFLAGLFPPKSFQIWHDQLPWQPVPVFPNLFDNSRFNDFSKKECPRFAQDQDISTANFVKDNKYNLTVLFESLQNKTGLVIQEGSFITAIKQLWDPLMCADSEGLQLANWAEEVYPEPLATFAYKAHLARSAASDVMARLIIGQMYGAIIEAMQAKINGTSKVNMYYYSGHDVTILSLQRILGLQDSISNLVNTGSALIYELHQNQLDATYFVKVLFIDGGSADLEPTLLSIPICNDPCDFVQLQNETRKFFNFSNFDEECKKTI